MLSVRVDEPLSTCLFGAGAAGLNLGVGALRDSLVAGVLRRRPDAELTVFDDGWGARSMAVDVDGTDRKVRLCGVRDSRRFHRRESYTNIRVSAALHLPGNPALRAIDSADAILDVSGGDSFTDLYGPNRFRAVTLPKQLALSRRRPLILLPQTYGPFKDPAIRRTAVDVLRRTTMAWARDEDSYTALRELLGDDFDATRHRRGVDMAFGLQPRTPRQAETDDGLRALLDLQRPLLGFNVSGLLLNDPDAAQRYGLTLDYRDFVDRFVARVLTDSDAQIMLVPHVLGAPAAVDADREVCVSLREALPAAQRERVSIVPDGLTPGETKWVISRMHWFCGTRMHATIAGLSSGVPTATVAYSLKTRGVFASCGQQDHVADARSVTTSDALEQMWWSWNARDETRPALTEQVAGTIEAAGRQMDVIIETADAGLAAPVSTR